MSYGVLDAAQKEAVRAVVRERTVYDLGAGDLSLAKLLLWLGATEIVAIDKGFMHGGGPKKPPARIQTIGAYFRDIKAERRQVGFCSWPSNNFMAGFVELASAFDVLIYLGSNVNGNACASQEFFEMQTQRTLLAYVPRRENSLVVTSSLPCKRKPTGEERAGLSINDGDSAIMGFDAAEAS